MNSANNANLKVSKEFVSDTRKQIKEMLMDPYKYWADLLGPNSVENVAYYCTELIEALANPNQQINDNYEGIYSTLLILEFYKNTK